MRRWVLLAILSGACSSGSTIDAGMDARVDGFVPRDAFMNDAPAIDARIDAPPIPDAGCTRIGRFPAGDGCNFCMCNPDGSRTCTTRVCEEPGGCDYDGAAHAFGERFPSSDGCNECVCAASGLACTRRSCSTFLEGAILLESLDEPCGDDETFTPRRVLDGLQPTELHAPFTYERAREDYPETLPDTEITLRIHYDAGFAVCRIPTPDQPALDIEVDVEWITDDGAFDEGFRTYLRRNNFGFVDAWLVFASASALNGTYLPGCGDAGDYGFSAQINTDGSAMGTVHKTCEGDLALTIGTFAR
jgi:hypothetical protein